MKRREKAIRNGSVSGRILIWCGLLLLLLSVAGFVFRFRFRLGAQERTEQVLAVLTERIPQEADQAALFADLQKGPEALPLIQVSGVVCAGILSIPDLRKEWPVGGLYEDMRKLPCLVKKEGQGTPVVIEGMDYESQFSILRQLAIGDEVRFTDVNGLKYLFAVDYTGTEPGRRENAWELELLSYMGEEQPYCVGCRRL